MFIRILFTTVVLSTLLFSQGRIIPEFPRPFPEPLPPVPIKLENVTADISINGDVARVKLEQSFKNESKRRLQGEYIYSLPSIAQISDFYLYINGQKTKG